MTLSRLMLFALGFFIVTAPVLAQVQGPMTAIQLQQLCKSRYDVDAGMCAGYVMAIAERLTQDSDPMHRVCLSPAISPQVLVDNVQRGWTVRAPAEQELATDNIAGVLRSRFRCP